ncbi:hypothetical protein [Ensifer canadensis]
MSAAQPGEHPPVNAGIHGEPTADCNDSLYGETQLQKTISRQPPVLNVDLRRTKAAHSKNACRCLRLSMSVVFTVDQQKIGESCSSHRDFARRPPPDRAKQAISVPPEMAT